MHVHAWCHAVFHVESSIITHGIKILHLTRCGVSRGIYTQVYMTRVIYTGRLLAMEASYTIHDNDYWHDKSQYSLTSKCILANYIILSVIQVLQRQRRLTAHIMQPETKEKPHLAALASQHRIIFMDYFNNSCNLNVCIYTQP